MTAITRNGKMVMKNYQSEYYTITGKCYKKILFFIKETFVIEKLRSKDKILFFSILSFYVYIWFNL